jgi:hypothetical protein
MGRGQGGCVRRQRPRHHRAPRSSPALPRCTPPVYTSTTPPPTPPARFSRSPAAPPRRCSRSAFLGAALLALAIVPLSTAYSICEAVHLPADIDDKAGQEPVFYASDGALLVIAGAIVLILGAPLISILVATQALNAVLLLAVLPFIRTTAAGRGVMGAHALGPGGERSPAPRSPSSPASVAALGVLAIP